MTKPPTPRAAACLCVSLAMLLATPWPAHALNIALTNDDGFEASFIHALYRQLKKAGHSVIISAPAHDQSGTGGSLDFLRPIGSLAKASQAGAVAAGAPGVGTLPGNPDVFYVGSTPVASALHGIDVAAPAKWGKVPDLLISGINFGNNTGIINNGSGTVNAALIAVNRGIPAIAASAEAPLAYRAFDQLSDGDAEYEAADIIVRLVAQLESRKALAGGALLPPGIGLNVNLPRFAKGGGAALPIRLSREGRAAAATPFFVADLSKDSLANDYIPGGAPALPGVALHLRGAMPPGLSSMPEDTDPASEQNVVRTGAVAITVMDGLHQAGRAPEAAVRLKLFGFAQ